ncbi:MAG: VacJ family lipoprotein [Spiribacter sp.]|nr:VacJ family lipoprotein [Spiribacter sp.]MDR9488788.1 VacJ family lipoprotein [Spiribacter sp.]
MWRSKGTILAMALIVLTGCAGGSNSASQTNTHDPIEGFNRGVYGFNEGVDTYALEPASRGWTRVTTSGIRRSVDHFFTNLEAPGTVVNALLQGKPGDAGIETVRFVLNSTVGLLGLFDPAETWLGLEGRREDFGQTLGVWGAESGPYVMLPLFGPSSGRDVTQYPVGYYTNVLTYIALDTATFGALTAVNIVNTRARGDRLVRFRDDSAVDPYVFTRSAYRQYRENQINNGVQSAEDDPYADFFETMEREDQAE